MTKYKIIIKNICDLFDNINIKERGNYMKKLILYEEGEGYNEKNKANKKQK